MTASSYAYTPLFRRYGNSRNSAMVLGAAVVASLGLLLLALAHRGDNLHLPNLRFLKKERCNPYDQHGFVTFDQNNTHANRWTPFNPTDSGEECKQPAPAFMASLLRASWAEQRPSLQSLIGNDWVDEELGPDGRPWLDVEFARNKTVFFLGDSISRFTTRYLCDMAGEQLIELNWKHPWSPPEIPKDYRGKVEINPPATPVDPPPDPFGWHKLPKGGDISHIGHYCYIPGMDFLLVHVHTYGLDKEDYWTFKPTYIPPYTYEERIHMLAEAYLARIRATTGRGSSAPELVYVNSGMWDVVKYSHEDTQAGFPTDTSLGHARLSEYRSRVRDIVLETANVFPQSKILWASTHYPLVQSNGWFFHDAQVKPKTRPDMKLIRLVQLHEAALSAIWENEDANLAERKILDAVGMNRWGLHMRGWEKQQVDDLHPKLLPGGYMWADMMLWDLRSAL